MLNLMMGDNVRPELAKLMVEFRRVQISRFPINVETRSEVPDVIRFVDSRFPKDTWNPKHVLAKLEVSDTSLTDNKPAFKLSSRLIENDKYAVHNKERNTKTTTDLKKMLKLLKEYVKPYSAQEIACQSIGIVDNKHDDWQTEPLVEYRRIAACIDRDDLAKEVLALVQRGVEFHTEKFRQMATEGLPHYIEMVRRREMPSCKTHVYIQPDNSVLVTTLNNNAGLPVGAKTYDTLEATPLALQQAVSMLMMIDGSTFVPEAGYKVSDNQFWIEVNPHELNSSNP